MKVHLIDGTYELFRAYYGAPSKTAPDGGEIGATQALLRGLLAFANEPGVTHLACAFDTVIESFRNELFAGYKTGEGIEPNLLRQFPLAEAACSAAGVVTWRMIEFEADDALATAAARFANHPDVKQVVVCSPDKDLAQCVVGARVVTWDRLRNKIYDAAEVEQKFGIAPASIPDFLALVGDSADGIPGVPRWGAKSAAALLARYRHLEHIPEKCEHWEVKLRGADRLAEELNANKQLAYLYRKLATLRLDVPLAEELHDLHWRGAKRELLPDFCASLGEPTLVERAKRWA